MLQFYNAACDDMSESESKLFSFGKILAGFIFCLVISVCIYLLSMFFVYAAWHCPSGNCQTKTWVDIVIFAIFASPLLVFIIGAYFSRNAVFALTENRFLRFLILMIFACSPILLIAGFVIYAINSTN